MRGATSYLVPVINLLYFSCDHSLKAAVVKYSLSIIFVPNIADIYRNYLEKHHEYITRILNFEHDKS
jgi:hypothetical protein